MTKTITVPQMISDMLDECYIAAQRQGCDLDRGQWQPTAADLSYVCDNLAFCPTVEQWREAGLAHVGGAHVGMVESMRESMTHEHERCNHDQLIVGCPLCEAAADARPQVIAALGQLADAWGHLNDLWHQHSDAAPINDLLDNGYPGNWNSFDEIYGELLQWFGTVRK